MTTTTIQQALRVHDDLWLEVAADAGFRVTRGHVGWVWYDGRGTIGVTPDDGFDPDDWLGQIVLHELCHHLVEGPGSRSAVDWGLENTTSQHEVHEHAALRLQAALCDRVHPDARELFVATTDYRGYYEAIPRAPLLPVAPNDARACDLAARGLGRFDNVSWSGAVLHAIGAAIAFSRQRGDSQRTANSSP